MGLVSNILKFVLKGKLNQIEKMGIPDDVKKQAKEVDKSFKKMKKSLQKAQEIDKKLTY
tara:strand:+ start:459 stop:635 length:177 start_codon:yes stop_codon:yes gene_type:complete